jgi:hypothetical protein
VVENYVTEKAQLYNLKDDLGETKDLSQQEPERAQRLLDQLKQWQKDVKAEFPKKIPDKVAS